MKNRLSVLAIVMLVLACLFITVTLVLFFLEGMFTWGSIDALFFKEKDLGDAVGGIVLWLFTFIFGIATVISGLVTLPFDIVLLKNVGKKWYALTLLIATAAFIILAVVLMVLVPVISSLSPSNASSSSVPSSSI